MKVYFMARRSKDGSSFVSAMDVAPGMEDDTRILDSINRFALTEGGDKLLLACLSCNFPPAIVALYPESPGAEDLKALCALPGFAEDAIKKGYGRFVG